MTQADTGADVGSRVLQRAKELDALLFGEFTLASGATSSYYFDGRMLTLDPEGANLAASALLPVVRASGAEAVGGPAVGAVSLVTSLAMLSGQDGGRRIPGFFVRAEAKDHGTGQQIEGGLEESGRCLMIEDTMTTGRSTLQAVEAVNALGATIVGVLTMVNRSATAEMLYAARGLPLISLFTGQELVEAARDEA